MSLFCIWTTGVALIETGSDSDLEGAIDGLLPPDDIYGHRTVAALTVVIMC
jgi:hypothetical protein